jgi:hypothetical protein
MKTRRFLLGLFMTATAFAAGLNIEFSGMMTSGGETKVSLTNHATGQTNWVVVGKIFGDYVVAAYEADTDTVVLTKDGQKFRLKFKLAKVLEAQPAAAGAEPSPETKKAILNNLRQLAAAADQFFLEKGKNQTTYDELVGPTKYVKKIDPVDGEDYRGIAFVQGKPIAVTTAGGYVMTYEP